MRQRTILSIFIVLISLCSFTGCKDGVSSARKTAEELEMALSEVQSDLSYVSSQMLSSEEVSIGRSSIISSSKAASSKGGSSKVTSSEKISSEVSQGEEVTKSNFLCEIGVGETYTVRVEGKGEWTCLSSPSDVVATSVDKSFSSNGKEETVITFLTHTPGIYIMSLKRDVPNYEVTISITVSPEPTIWSGSSSVMPKTMKVGQTYTLISGRPTGYNQFYSVSPSNGIDISSYFQSLRHRPSRLKEIESGYVADNSPLGHEGAYSFTFVALIPGVYTVCREGYYGLASTHIDKEIFTITVTE